MSLGGGGGGSDIRAGGAFVELFAKDAELHEALERSEKKLSHFGEGLGLTKLGFAMLIPDLLKLVTVGVAFGAAIEQAAELKGLANEIGQSVEETSRLAFAFQQVGINAEEFALIAGGLNKHLFAQRDSNTGIFHDLGLSAKELMRLPLHEQLLKIGDALLQLPAGTMRSGAAFEIFGKQGAKALRLLAKGPEHLAEVMAKADQVGATVTEEQAEQAEKIEESWNAVKASLVNAFLQIGRALLPEADAIAEFSKMITEIVGPIGKWIGENKALVIGIVAGAAAFVALDVAVIAAGVSISAMGAVAGAFGAAFSAGIGMAGAALGALLSPVALVVAGLVGLGAAAVGIFANEETEKFGRAVEGVGEAASEMRDRLVQGFQEAGEEGRQAFDVIVARVKAGDIEGAFEAVTAYLSLQWAKVAQYWTRQWIGFKEIFVDGWHTVGDAVSTVWNEITYGLESTLRFLSQMFVDTVNNLIKIANKAISRLNSLNPVGNIGKIGLIPDSKLPEWQREIDKEHRDEEQRIADGRLKRKAENEKFRNEQLNAAAAEFVGAKRRFNEELAKPGGPELLPMPHEVKKKAELSDLATSAKGTFYSPNYSRLFAVGDTIAKQSLIEQKKANENLVAIRAAFGNLPLAAFK